MKSRLALICILLAAATPAVASPGVFLGLTYNLGNTVGISLKILSTNNEDRAALAAGVSYFPFSKKFGVEAGGAYVFKDAAVTFGWDFLNEKPQWGLGYVKTKSKNEAAPTVVAATPAADPEEEDSGD